jgi:FlaA1/EpsC-like NDP-sugar epimerase
VSRLRTTLDWILAHRRPFVIVFHLVLATLSSYSAIWLRFDGTIPATNWEPWVRALPWLLLLRALAFARFGLYQGLWRYASIWDLRNIVAAVATSSLAQYVVLYWVLGLTAFPRAALIIDSGVLVLLMGGARLTRRLAIDLGYTSTGPRVLLYGAGDAGEAVVREMRNKGGGSRRPVGFVDDDRSKVGHRIHGVPVLGTRADLPAIMAHVQPDEILLAIPHADQTVFRSVVRALDRYNIPIKTLPTLREILENKVEISQIRNLSVQDLLSRGPVGLDPLPVRNFIKGRRIMVTGAGGSIGSELCRQIAAFDAAEIVLFDRSEAGLFNIENELADLGHSIVAHAIVGDVTDRARVEQVLRHYRPDMLFHAAAHKHVPLMEGNACEAVKNNIGGTRIVAECAEQAGVDRFVLISTDKAVNPSSVMGVTKRVAELMLQTQGRGSGTTFITVRFGNVLASSGSVVPRFLQQIKAGGPVTVTHPDVRRFFMLIPEAVQLVLHAAAGGEAGRLYILEMGEPVRLVDMARDLIRLAGFSPDTEIPITFVGLRPGEKLSEDLVGGDETAAASSMAKVMTVTPLTQPDRKTLVEAVARVECAASAGDTAAVLKQLADLVPTFGQTRPDLESAPVPVDTAAPPVADVSSRKAPKAVGERGRQCPTCGSYDVQRSHIRSRVEHLRKSVTSKRPYRCRVCGWRGWTLPMDYGVPSGPSVDLDALLAPNLHAIDDSVVSVSGSVRLAFSPRDLPASPKDTVGDQLSPDAEKETPWTV